ncbi:MAG: acyltransferase [Bacteroidetes bacterium]|nr:acyltransferase [Bacteroidota bacterium]
MVALDGMRGMAVLLVILSHSYNAGPLAHWADLGWIGVDLFFVLSGFLISGILLDTRGQKGYFKRFIIRRALRIFPLYYLTLATIFLLEALHPVPAVRGLTEHQAWFWSYMPNLFFAFHGWASMGKALNHFWSLAIEEQFYLAWPWVIAFAGERWLVRFILAGIGFSILLRFIHPVSPFSYAFTLARLDGLLAGALLAWGLRRRSAWVARYAPIAFMLGIVLIISAALAGRALFRDPHMMRWGVSGATLLFAGLVGLTVKGGGFDRFFRMKPLCWLGRYSYGLYVIHWPLYVLLFLPLWSSLNAQGWDPHTAWTLTALLYSLLLLALAMASYEWMEKRFLALKDRIAPYDRPA